MDPLSISASIAALLKLTSSVIQYLADVKGALEGRLELLNEVSSLSGFLFVLKDLAERARWTGSWCTTIRALDTENGPLDQCKRSMERLALMLGPNSSKARRALAWPFQKQEVKGILQTIERQKVLFVLALQNDHITLSLKIKDDMERVQDGVQEITHQLSRLQHRQETWLQGNERNDLLAWLTPLNFWTKQNDAFGRWQEGTGEWLLNHQLFEKWLSGAERILWCPGIPGAGKTILASVVINYLEERFEHENVGIAYIYCTYRDQNQTALDLIASLLKQLIDQRPIVSCNILELYRHHRSRQTRPPLTEVSRFLLAELRHFSKVFIVIDALDECSEESRIREHFLAEVMKLLPMICLLVTSRVIPDMERRFEAASRLEIYASGTDIRRYLEGRIERELPLADFVGTDPSLRTDILTTIVQKSDGMFLLAQLHMDSLVREYSKKGVKRALKSLPEELDATHEEAMKRIHSQDPEKVRRAEQILSWICYAARPMTVDEIRSALAVEPGDTDMDEEALLGGDFLVSVCAGLITIDRDSSVIRFVHYSTQEYFERNRADRFRTALTEIVRTCLTYLSFNKFAEGPCRSDKEMEIRLREYPLLQYASQYWGDHARGEPEKDKSIQDLILGFLEQESKTSCSIQVTHCIPGHRYEGYSQKFPGNVSGLEIAATLGLREITRKLLENGAEVNKKDSDDGTALHWAAWGGYETVARLLLDRQADVHAEYSSKSTPLHWAAEGGHEPLVRLLLENGAIIATEDTRGWTPMHRAAWNGYDAVVNLFLENRVDVNAKDSDGGTVLHGAAENGHEGVVRLLLDKGAEVDSKDLDGGTPLHRAAWNGHAAVARLLLERGANVTARYCQGDSKRRSGQEVVVRLLLEKGADVAAKYFRGGTALHWAAWSGHEAVVQLLLDNGADFTAKDSDGGTALSGAAQSGYEAVAQILREKEKDGAAEHSDDEVGEEQLQKQGANSAAGELHWAAWGGREAVVLPLLEGGANVNATNLHGRTALHWAAWSGHEAIVQLLLDQGADISVKDNGKWTALHWAAWNGHGAVVQLLLGQGAEIRAEDANGKTAQDWANASRHEAVVQLLSEYERRLAASLPVGSPP